MTCLFRLESSLAPSLISQPFSITSAKPSSTSCSLLVCIAVKQTQKIRQVRRTANNSRSSDKGSLSKDDDDDGSEDVKNAKGSDAVYRVADKFLNGRIFYLCKQFTPNHANSVTDSRTLCQ